MTSIEEAQAAAILTAVDASLQAMAKPRRAYDFDDAPKSGEFVLVDVARRFGGNLRGCGVSSPTGWRVSVRAIGAGVGNARILLDRATAALEFQQLTVEGRDTTPIQFETEDPITQDETSKSSWTGLRTFTYAH